MAKPSRGREKTSDIGLELDKVDGLGINSRVLTGSLAAFMLVCGFGGWAATSELSGAVIGQGQVIVDKDLRAIQHLDGGIIKSIAIKKGDVVKQGQVMFTLDDTQLTAELHILRGQLVELMAKRQRLLTEREGLDVILPLQDPAEMDIANSPAFAGESRLFTGNHDNRVSQIKQLQSGLAQLDEEINGFRAQAESNGKELALVQAEVTKVENLQKKGLIDSTRVYGSARDLTKLKGEREQIGSNIERSKSRRIEIELQILAIDATARTEAQKQLSEIEPRIAEIRERESAIENRLTRMEIRAPIAGTINEISVNTIGGVITPAQKLLTIVPENAKLQIEVKISPTDIDQIYVDQPAKLRFSAFSARNTPELSGTIAFVSPATSVDQSTSKVFYTAQVDVSNSEFAKLGNKKLVPGMPVETFVQTESRTALSYLIKPFADQIQRAFREQ